MSFVLQPGQGRGVTALGSTYRILTDGTDVAGAFSASEEEFWAESTLLHVHLGAEEVFYVLGGRVRVWTEDAVIDASSGAFIVVPRGAPHALRRLSSEPVRMLTLISPPGFERLFGAVAEQGEEELLSEPERLIALADAYGTTILGDYPD